MGGFELIVGIVPVVVIVIFVLATSVRILREYERAVIFRFGRRANAVFNPGGDGSGPGPDPPDPLGGQAGEGQPADRHDGRAVPGRDHARQRVREGERRDLLSRA
jgi:hypothetical protein